MPCVSILIPVYKGARFIERTLQSALAQTHTNIEIILVNDGSPDNCEDLIRPYLVDPRVRYLKQTNSGVAAARNVAINQATGDYLALLDQDDLWRPEKLVSQLDLFATNPKLGLVHCHAIPIDASDGPMPANPGRPRATLPQAFAEIFLGNPIQACAGMFSRAALDAVGGFDPAPALRFADEYDLWLRIASRFEVGYVPETLAYYRLHGENNSADLAPMVRATLAVLAKTRREQPAAVAAISRRQRNARYARLYLDLADSGQASDQPFTAAASRLRAWCTDPVLSGRRWLGPQRLDRWQWRLAQAQRFFKGGGMQ